MIDQPADRPRRPRLLVVEDEPSICALLESTLRLTGYEVGSAGTGRAALAEIERSNPQLLLLDVMLPDLDGFEVTRRLRAAGNDVPVLFLTARTGLDDRIRGLGAGGDDCVSKPFSPEEVLPRIEAILRRTAARATVPEPEHTVRRYADLELDADAHEVHRAGQYVRLSPTEFKQKIDGFDPPLIHTVRGVGYCLRLPRKTGGGQ